MPSEDGRNALRDDVDAVGRTVTDDLATVAIRPLALAARGWLALQLRRASSYEEATEVLHTLEAELSAMAATLRGQRSRLSALRESRTAVDPFGEAWRDDVRARLSYPAPGQQRTDVWRSLYAEAFTAHQFGACLWLCDTDGVRPDGETPRRLRGSAEAAQHGLLYYTLPALELLTDPACGGLLDDDVLGRCWVMRARAVCRGLNEPGIAVELVRPLLESPRRWPPATRAALHVTLGEALLEQGYPAAARDEVHRALVASEAEPSAHVLGGLIAEAAREVTRAEQLYDAALALDAERVVSGRLFAPVPPILLWRHGRRLRGTDGERAVTAIERAVEEARALPSSAFPERKAYVDLARTHDALGNRPEAARCYTVAARRYAAKGDQSTARQYLGLAVERQPDKVEYLFLYAEALRLDSVHQDGLVDLDRLDQAARHWSRGMQLAATEGGKDAWVYATGASIAHLGSGDLYRPRPSTTAVVVLERGLLVAPADRQVLGQLSQAHRLIGNPWTALELSRQGLDQDAGHEVLFDQQLLALLELERSQEVLDLVTSRPVSRRTPWLVNRTVQALVELGRPDEAVEVLERNSTGDEVMHALQLGLCHWLAGRPEEALQAYSAAAERAQAEGQQRDNYLAWALHLLGRHADAVDVYESLVTADPRDPSLHWEYGQALLGRGRAGDTERGARELLEGIRMSRSRYALSFLLRWDLPRLVDLTEGTAHADDVRAAVAHAAGTAIDLREDLGSARTPLEELHRCLDLPGHPADDDDGAERRRACLAGLARLEAATDRSAALHRYLELGADPVVPEAGGGTRQVARDLWAEAEATAQHATPADGLAVLEAVLSVLAAAPGVPPDVVTHTRLRAAVLAARARRPERFTRHLTAALAEPATSDVSAAVASHLIEAVDTLPTYWQLRDAAEDMRGRAVRGSPEREAAERLLDALPLAHLLRTRREDVDQQRMYPLLTPLAIRVGAALWPSDDADRREAWQAAVTELRRRIHDDVGVLLPQIALGLDTSIPDDEFRVELYDDVRVRGTLPTTGDRDSALWAVAVGTVVGRLEEVARSSLNRLFTIDDVALWLGGGASPDASRQALARTSRSERLELLRLLRLLLREQIPIVDRDAVLAEVLRLEPHWSAPAALPAVRRRLLRSRRTADVEAVPGVALPVELEHRLRAGLRPDDGLWQLPREEATDLTTALAAWHGSVGSPRCVTTRDPELRPYLWRLLAVTADLPVRVLCEEEIGAHP